MVVTRTIALEDIAPAELATMFCEMGGLEQAEFFAEVHAIAATWPGAGWCWQACSIAEHITKPGFEVITKLAEHVLGFDDLVATLYQYEADLQYPPDGDSKQRRLEHISKVIAKATSSEGE